MSALEGLTALEREQLRYIVERVEWPERCAHMAVYVALGVNNIVGYSNGAIGFYEHADRDSIFTRAQYDAMKAELSAPVRKTGREGDACPCSGSANWNIPAWKIPICDNPEYGEDGLCNNCDHEKACHDVGFAPAIDYRAHCEALAGALEKLTLDRHYFDATGEDNRFCGLEGCGKYLTDACHLREGESYQKDMQAAVTALTRWKEEGK